MPEAEGAVDGGGPAAGSTQEHVRVITGFVQAHVARAGANGVVVGMSGGLDSALAAALAAKALGPDQVLGLVMPAPDSDPQDRRDAEEVCRHLGMMCVVRPIGPALAGVLEALEDPSEEVAGNAKARLRMLLLYAEAQSRGLLVCGTGNKSELLTGYFTKHGDGGADLLPIGDLYKSQVVEVARHLGLPAAVIEKPPSAGLRPGQTDEADLGMPYPVLDKVLKGFELNRPPEQVARRTGVALGEVLRVADLVRRSEHKRRTPLIPKIGVRTVGIDWRRSVHWDAEPRGD